MTNFTVNEGEGSVREELKNNPDIKVGDTIEYISNNQMGYEKYKVILGANGEKSLKLIDSYDHQMGLYNDNDTEDTDDEDKYGGKRRKTNKRRKTKTIYLSHFLKLLLEF